MCEQLREDHRVGHPLLLLLKKSTHLVITKCVRTVLGLEIDEGAGEF